MIIDFIIQTFVTVTKGIFYVLPTIPATPQAVVDGGNWVITTIGGVMGILNMLFTPTLMAAVVLIAIGIFNFEWIYHSVMWVLKKIPILNIK